MKSIKSLFTLAFVLCFGLSYGQLQVANSNNVVVGPGVPNAKMEVRTTAGGPEFVIDNTSSTNPDFTLQSNTISVGQFKYIINRQGLEFQANSNSGTSGGLTAPDFIMHLNANTKNCGIGTNNPSERLQVVGNILYSGSSMQGSDRSLKKNINSLERGLKDILKIKTYSFQYNDKANMNNDALHYGVIAQELQEIAPELVGSFTHEIWEDAEDGETEKLVGSEEYLHVNVSAIQWMLVNAVKEQQELLNDKDVKIQALETRLSRLEALVSKK